MEIIWINHLVFEFCFILIWLLISLCHSKMRFFSILLFSVSVEIFDLISEAGILLWKNMKKIRVFAQIHWRYMGNPSDISNRPKAVVVAGKGGMQRTGQSASSFDELRLPAGVLINPNFFQIKTNIHLLSFKTHLNSTLTFMGYLRWGAI